MRPLELFEWTTPQWLDFSGSSAGAIVAKVFTTDHPPTTSCLELWDDDVSGARVLTGDEQLALTAIKNKVTSEYRKANSPLLDHAGAYCAYCELPLHDPIQVEHVLPKSQYPTYSLSAYNFLPACIGCNSRKREAPLRSTTAQWLRPGQDTPSACYDEIRFRRFRWPDVDDIHGYFTVSLLAYDQGAWTKCSDPVDSQIRERSTSIVKGEVRADLPASGLTDTPVAAIVENAAQDDPTTATIELCVLDRLPQTAAAADRRTIYRTKAWLRAVRTLRPIYDAGLPTELPETVRDIVVTGGFFWVWVTVAELIDTDLRDFVVAGTKDHLPGTEDTRLP